MIAKKTKSPNKTKTHPRNQPRLKLRAVERTPDEPELPIGALLEIADWTLDQALIAAYDDPADVEKVERVRAFMHGRIEGVRTRMPSESDFLSVMALAIAAMEQRHHIHGLGEYVAEVVDQAMDGVRVASAPGYASVPLGPRIRRAPCLTPHLYCMP